MLYGPCADDALTLRIRLSLDRSNVRALRDVIVRVDGDRVTLSGTVGTYYQKQLATELTNRVDGIDRHRQCDRGPVLSITTD